jgi:hypothetical protein
MSQDIERLLIGSVFVNRRSDLGSLWGRYSDDLPDICTVSGIQSGIAKAFSTTRFRKTTPGPSYYGY